MKRVGCVSGWLIDNSSTRLYIHVAQFNMSEREGGEGGGWQKTLTFFGSLLQREPQRRNKKANP